MKKWNTSTPLMALMAFSLLLLTAGCSNKPPAVPAEQAAFFDSMVTLRDKYQAVMPESPDPATKTAKEKIASEIKLFLMPETFNGWVGKIESIKKHDQKEAYSVSIKMESGKIQSVKFLADTVEDKAMITLLSTLKEGDYVFVSGKIPYLNRSCFVGCEDPWVFISSPAVHVALTQIKPR